MDYYNNDHYQRSYEEESHFDHGMAEFITHMLIWSIGLVSLPLNGATIFATFSQVQKDVTRIYVMNLLVSDLLQLCAMMDPITIISYYAYLPVLMASVGFRMCVALERCSLVFRPQGSCFTHCVKVCAVVCFFVWVVRLCFFISFTALGPVEPLLKVKAIFLLLPCPFLIFALVVSHIASATSQVSLYRDTWKLSGLTNEYTPAVIQVSPRWKA